MVGELPIFVGEFFVESVLAHVQRDEEVSEDAADVERHQSDDEVVTPFGREEALEMGAQFPDHGFFAVDFDDVASYEVARRAEGVEIAPVRGEEGGALGASLGFGVFHFEGVLRACVHSR